MAKADGVLAWPLHLAVLAVLLALNFVLPDYHHGIMARILVLAVFASGYNLLFGYAGLLSLGHALFFAAGLYGAGLSMTYLGAGPIGGFASGLIAGAIISLMVGLLALRTSGVAFMIVTMMFAQAAYLTILYFNAWTGGDQGLVLQQAARVIELGGTRIDLTDPETRYLTAWGLFAVTVVLMLVIARSRFGRVLVAIRENEERTRMLGFDAFANKLAATVISGTMAAAAGAAYAILFGYVGSTFASVQYSILPLLWVLLGGGATVLGALLGTVLMYYLVDGSSDVLQAWLPAWKLSHLGVVGVALILLVLFFPKGILGTVRERWARALP